MTEVVIAGKRYPMHFSIGASKAITRKFGGLKAMGEAMSAGDEAEALEAVTFITQLLIAQGCAYKNLCEKNVPAAEDAPIIDGKYVPLTAEEIDIALGVGSDMQYLFDKIHEAVFEGKERKVEAEEIETKNPAAT